MSELAYKHTWTVRRDAWFIRFYLWAWEAEAYKITFCKLFWGYVFAPPNLLLRSVWLLLWPLRVLTRKLPKSEGQPAPKPKVEKEEVPGRISEFFARPGPRRAAKIIGFLLLIPTGLVLVGAFVWGLTLLPAGLVALGQWFIHTDAWAVVAYLGGWAVVVVGVSWLDKRFHFDERLKARKKRKHEAGEATFGDVLLEGARAVKSNTCPRVEVK